MISDTNSPAYKIASDLATHWLKYHNEQILAQNFDAHTAGMKFWERSAVKETFQCLIRSA